MYQTIVQTDLFRTVKVRRNRTAVLQSTQGYANSRTLQDAFSVEQQTTISSILQIASHNCCCYLERSAFNECMLLLLVIVFEFVYIWNIVFVVSIVSIILFDSWLRAHNLLMRTPFLCVVVWSRRLVARLFVLFCVRLDIPVQFRSPCGDG